METGVFLPEITCSSCAAQIAISSIGDHVCTPPSGAERLDSPRSDDHAMEPIVRSASIDSHNAAGAGASWSGTRHANNLPPLRTSRTAPPRIDPAAANKPFVQKDTLSPGAFSNDPTLLSPIAPRSVARAPHSPMRRNMTSPLPRIQRPPSPKLSSNLDCAFPPFPSSRPSTASGSRSRSAGTTAHASALGEALHAEPESYTGPRSPMTTGGANVMQRMNTIAPGPFDARRRARQEDEAPADRVPSPQSTLLAVPGSATDVEELGTASQDVRPVTPSGTSPLSHGKLPSFTAIAPPPVNKEGRPVPQRPVRPEPLDGFLAMLKTETEASETPLGDANKMLRPESRSSTCPLTPGLLDSQAQDDSVATRRPSEHSPGIQQIAKAAALPSTSGFTDHPGSDVMESTALEQSVPPLAPLPAIQTQSYEHTAHTPTGSASSTSSIRSYGTSSLRSDMSPPISAASSVSMISSSLETSSRVVDPTLMVPSLQLRPKPSKPQLRGPDMSLTVVSAVESTASMSPASAHQEPLNWPISPSTQHPADAIPQSPDGAGEAPKKRPVHRSSTKRPGTATKHHCRGCKEAIIGKSVKAADGRLTGRYHKHCFVCKTCRSPFATADFYVINNEPYCEQHYHKLNHSLCAKCDRGIEGPYLETQQAQKFHPNCFTCQDCRKVLSDDYFEIGASVYCEQHAFTALRRHEGLGPKRNMERRTTRLMMMNVSL